jgi:hypothetical protein
MVKNRAATEGGRDGVLVSDGGAEICRRLALFFHHTGEAIKTAEAFQLLCVTELCSIERPAQNSDGLVIRFQRYGKWMAILAAMREGKSRGV